MQTNKKFADRIKSILNNLGIKCLNCYIYEEEYLIFTFNCPCGELLTKAQRLPAEWKNQFKKTEDFIKREINEHLKEEGFLN